MAYFNIFPKNGIVSHIYSKDQRCGVWRTLQRSLEKALVKSEVTPVESGAPSSGAWNSYIGAFGSSSGAQISCSGASSSSSRACISSSGQRLQSLETPDALSFSRALPFLLGVLPRYHILMVPGYR